MQCRGLLGGYRPLLAAVAPAAVWSEFLAFVERFSCLSSTRESRQSKGTTRGITLQCARVFTRVTERSWGDLSSNRDCASVRIERRAPRSVRGLYRSAFVLVAAPPSACLHCAQRGHCNTFALKDRFIVRHTRTSAHASRHTVCIEAADKGARGAGGAGDCAGSDKRLSHCPPATGVLHGLSGSP